MRAVLRLGVSYWGAATARLAPRPAPAAVRACALHAQQQARAAVPAVAAISAAAPLPPPPLTLTRFFSSSAGIDTATQKRLDEFQDLFVEARECIGDTVESTDSVYFDEDAEEAMAAVNVAVAAFDAIIADLDEATRGEVMRANGLKVEQLKGELEMALHPDH